MVLMGPSGRRSRLASGCTSGMEGCPPLMTSRSTTAMVAPSDLLADARELIALQHIHDPSAPDARLQHDEPLWILDDDSDDLGVASVRPSAHAAEHAIDVPGRDHGQQLPLVGHVERIEPEQLAHTAHRFPHD